MDKIFTAEGPIEAENRLLELVMAEVERTKANPNLLAHPALIVVPSSELRLNLIVRLAAAGATLGVEVQTLHSLALNLHRSAGNDTTSRSMLSEVLARRATLQQPGLSATFQPLADGLGVVASSIRDLLSAGLNADLGAGQNTDLGVALSTDSTTDSAADLGTGLGSDSSVDSAAGSGPAFGADTISKESPATTRTHEVLKAAEETRQSMLQRGCRRPGDLQTEAAGLVEAHLHARAVWIYGFADVTGQSKKLIQALWKWGASLVIDLPCDPAFGGEDRGAQFARRFVSKVSGVELGEIDSKSQLRHRKFFHSSGRADEVREVAHRIRDLLSGRGEISAPSLGFRSNANANASNPPAAQPEKIGVVVRDFNAYAAEFRYWFDQLGVPFRSAPAPAGFFPDHRRMQAAIEVMQRGRAASVDRWLDALSRSERSGALASKLEDFRIAMRTLGVARMEQAAALDAGQLAGKNGVYRLPVRTQVNDEAPSSESAPRSQTRKLTIAQLTADIGLLQQTLERIKNWPARATLSAHADYARIAFEKDFGWRSHAAFSGADWPKLLSGIAGLDLKHDDYTADEFMILLAKAARNYGTPLAGSIGGGVAVLDFTQARGRSFEHVFILGLNRGAVPRAISEDPVLPDQQRSQLQNLLPDLQKKSCAHDEERYLFAQLCSSAPNITLSWLRADDDGKELAPSPFLQRIWLAGRSGEAEDDAYAVPRLRSELFEKQNQPLSRAEAEQYFALRGKRDSWQDLMNAKTAEAQHRVLNEIEPDFSQDQQREVRDTVGPYLGWIGERTAPMDKVYVTRLEGIAGCPWRSLLTSRLRLEPVADPLHDLPSTNALMIGNVVHDALEQLVRDGAKGRLADGARDAASSDGSDGDRAVADAIQVPRPMPEAIHDALKASAVKVALQEEMRLQGMIDALTSQAGPFLHRAIQFEWPDADSVLQVVGCEVTEQTHLNSGGLEFDLHFRADRVDRDGDHLIYTDYKTAKPMSSAKKEETRIWHHLKKVQSGNKLQGTAYAGSHSEAVGRYLFLNVSDDAELDAAEFKVGANDEEFVQAFSQTSGVLYQSLLLGVAPPRMETLAKQKENPVCGYCDVADACLLNDSGNRRRLVGAIEKLAERREASSLSKAESNLTDLWYLGADELPWVNEEEQS